SIPTAQQAREDAARALRHALGTEPQEHP
ncbi:MAG: hypothetical protein RL657_1638, partial [Pseudomonadota bacterium]